MRLTITRPWLALSVATSTALPAMPGALAAQDRIDYWVECVGGLVHAAGVIGPRHDYEFNGECALWRMVMPEDTDEWFEGPWNHDEKLMTFAVRGRASWERESGRAEESLQFQGPITGQTVARGTCIKDPFLEPTPCNGVTRQTNAAGGPHLDRVITAFARNQYFRFFGQFPLAEAQALSGQQPPKNPPPPPPKSPPVIEDVAVRHLVIGRDQQVVRLTVRGAKPLTAWLSKETGLPRPVTLDDPRPGAASRSVAVRVPADAVRIPGLLTITLRNASGSAHVKLAVCPADGGAGPKGCPTHVKAGAGPAPIVAAPAAPLAPVGRSQRAVTPDSTSPRRAARAVRPPTQEAP